MEAPWYSRQNLKLLRPGQTIAVLGAGLAGSAIARVLAKQDYSVQVFDPHGISERASGNTAALFNVQLSKLPNPMSRLCKAALDNFSAELKILKIPAYFGIFREKPQIHEYLSSGLYASDSAEVLGSGVIFPHCGIIHPKTLCEARLAHPLIQFSTREVTRVEKKADQWQLEFKHGQVERVDHVVYALGADSSLKINSFEHPLINFLPLRPIRGQTILVKPTPRSRHLNLIKVNDGYATPLAPEVTGHDYHLLGATYQPKLILENQEELDTLKLVQDAREKWPEFQDLSMEDVVSSRAGFRCSTPDKLPLVGPLCDPQWLKINYESFLKGSVRAHAPLLEPSPGEWIVMGLGSRGVTFSSIAAEILASLMTGSEVRLEEDLLHALHPARFYVRNLRKNLPSSTL